MVLIMLTSYQILSKIIQDWRHFLKLADCQSKHKVIIPYEQLQINVESKLLTKMRKLQVIIFNLIEKIFQRRILKNFGLLECDETTLFLSKNRCNILDSHNYQLLYVITPWKVLQTFRKGEGLYYPS